MVEASRRHGRWSWRRMNSAAAGPTGMTDVLTTAPNETELEEAGSRRLLAAVDELSERTSHLKRRREQLWASLPALSKNRAETYRLNSDALRLPEPARRTRIRRKMARLSEDEVTADEAMRGAQREIRQLDEELRRNGRRHEGRPVQDSSWRTPAAAGESSRRVVPSRRFERRARVGCIATAAAAPRRPSTFCAKALRGRAFRRSACPPPKL